MLLCCAILSISFPVTKVIWLRFSPLSLVFVARSSSKVKLTTTESEKSQCLLHMAKKNEENLWKNNIIWTEMSFLTSKCVQKYF